MNGRQLESCFQTLLQILVALYTHEEIDAGHFTTLE